MVQVYQPNGRKEARASGIMQPRVPMRLAQLFTRIYKSLVRANTLFGFAMPIGPIAVRILLSQFLKMEKKSFGTSLEPATLSIHTMKSVCTGVGLSPGILLQRS